MTVRLLLASFAALALTAQPAPGPRGPMGMGMGMGPGGARGPMAQAGENAAFLAHHLKLTDAQKAQIKAIHEKGRTAAQARRKAAQEARQALQQAMHDPATPAEKLRSLHQAAADQQFQAMMARRGVQAEVREVLTPEQRAEADKLRALGEERRKFRAERMRRGMGDRPGRLRGPGMMGEPGMGRPQGGGLE